MWRRALDICSLFFVSVSINLVLQRRGRWMEVSLHSCYIENKHSFLLQYEKRTVKILRMDKGKFLRLLYSNMKKVSHTHGIFLFTSPQHVENENSHRKVIINVRKLCWHFTVWTLIYSVWHVSTTRSTNNECVGIGTGPWSHKRTCCGLMNYVSL